MRKNYYKRGRTTFGLATMVLSVASMGACLAPSGYSFLVEEDARPIVDRSLVDTIRELRRDAEASWPRDLAPLVHADNDPELARRDLVHNEVPIPADECRRLQPVLSFVHLSDVQLKEHSVSLAGVLGENIYDLVADGAVRHPDLEQYDYAVLLATVLGINSLGSSASHADYGECPPPLAPAFAIHTGDAIDASMFSELFEFVAIMGQLDIPFYNVVGNHDVLFFGTFPTDAMKGLNVVLPFVPVHNVQRFMRAHSFEAGLDDISIPHVPRDEHAPTTRARSGPPIRVLPRSHYHGFDLACEPRTGRLCDEAPGYYTIDMQVQGFRARKPHAPHSIHNDQHIGCHSHDQG